MLHHIKVLGTKVILMSFNIFCFILCFIFFKSKVGHENLYYSLPYGFHYLSVLLCSLKTTALVYLGKDTYPLSSPATHSYVSPDQQWDASYFIAGYLWTL